jgi:hypothetical protein
MNDGFLAAKTAPATGLKLQQKMTLKPVSAAYAFCLWLQNYLALLHGNIDAYPGGKTGFLQPVAAEHQAWMAAVMARAPGFRILMPLSDIADFNLTCAFGDTRYCCDVSIHCPSLLCDPGEL